MDKRVLIVAGILVVAVGVVLLAKSRKEPPPGPKTEAAPFPELQAERPKGDANWVHPAVPKIDRMEITKGGATLELRRTKPGDGKRSFGDWEIVKPYKYPADENSVRMLIQRSTSLNFWEPASKSRDDHGAMGVDDALGLRVTLYEKDRKMADFYLGREVSTEVNERPLTYTYLRAAGQNTVWKISASLKILTDKEMSAWRDPKILHLKREEITELTISSPAGTITVTRDAEEKDPKKRNDNWVLKSSEPQIPALEISDVSRIASTLSYLRTQDFVDAPKAEETGLDKPLFQVGVTTKDKESHTLLLGKTTEKSVKRGKQDVKEKLIYLQVKGKPQVFLIQENRVSAFMKTPIELRDRSVVRLSERQKVKRLEVHIKDTQVAFAHDGKAWKAEKPEGLAFDPKALERDLQMLSGRFTAKEFAKETDPAKTGLDKPQGRLVITVETSAPPPPAPAATMDAMDAMGAPAAMGAPDAMGAPADPMAAPRPEPRAAPKPAPGKLEVIEVLVGKEAEKRDYFVQVKGRPEIFVVPQYTLQRLWKEKDKWNPPKRAPGAGMPGQMPGQMPGRPGRPGRPPGRF